MRSVFIVVLHLSLIEYAVRAVGLSSAVYTVISVGMTQNRLTLMALADLLAVSRPTAYSVVRAVDFPIRGDDGRWDRDQVMDWLDRNRLPDGVSVVGGLMVRS